MPAKVKHSISFVADATNAINDAAEMVVDSAAQAVDSAMEAVEDAVDSATLPKENKRLIRLPTSLRSGLRRKDTVNEVSGYTVFVPSLADASKSVTVTVAHEIRYPAGQHYLAWAHSKGRRLI